jgi:hypothetical protein
MEKPQHSPRNRVVVSTETGHPGFKNYVFQAPARDLEILAEQLAAYSREPTAAGISMHITGRGDPKSLGSLVFRYCTEQQLIEMHQRDPRRFTKWLAAVAMFFVFQAIVITLAINVWSDFHCCKAP